MIRRRLNRNRISFFVRRLFSREPCRTGTGFSYLPAHCMPLPCDVSECVSREAGKRRREDVVIPPVTIFGQKSNFLQKVDGEFRPGDSYQLITINLHERKPMSAHFKLSAKKLGALGILSFHSHEMHPFGP